MPLTEDQRKKIAAQLFLLSASQPVLSVPVNTDNGTVAGELGTRMKSVTAINRFKDVSWGIVDFTATNPKIFMYKGELPWRMGSSGKIAVLLAAAQLRDDVRKAKDVLVAENVTLTPKEFDQLFATIWSRSKVSYVSEITSSGLPPRVSTLFDLSMGKPDFRGGAVNTSLDRVDGSPGLWADLPAVSVVNRLWLMGAKSDNISATSCISEIGLAYIRAVQKAYGLWLKDRKKGMHMLFNDSYWNDKSGDIPKTPLSTDADAPKHRLLGVQELNEVTDGYLNANDKKSFQAGSVAALTAYMMALNQDKLVDAKGCEAIKQFLADGRNRTLPGSLFHGIEALAPGVKIDKGYAKGGALKAPPSKVITLRSDLAYMETDGTGGKRKFALVAMGLVEVKDGADTFDPEAQGQALAKAIYAALIA